MRRYAFTVPEETDVKTFLRRRCGVSASMLTRLKQVENGITVNGAFAWVTQRLFPGDEVALCMPEDTADGEAICVPLRVVYEDEDFLVIDKPPGMPVHPSAGHEHDSLAQAVRGYYRERNETTAFRPLYRLDKDTSGLVVAAKNSYAAAACRVEKDYFAVCRGHVAAPGTVDAPIGLLPGHSIQRCVGVGQPAVTHYVPLAWDGTHTLVRCRLETGRTHQIRVHMASIGHPLAGDDMYGGSLAFISRQALHCGRAKAVFPPLLGPLVFHAPFPEDICRAFPALFVCDPMAEYQE